ncbi:MAG TPA: twin-arginine translocation signal domain-containing protein [Gammaproteobacteria bacterium]|nr:twin-arginine translocation signal domain-containing protein [Gammaproteobacteria bacterium]
MDNPLDKKFSRRTFIKSAALAAGAAAVPALMFGGGARAASKLPKSAVQYQDHPKDGKQCSECIQFIPGPKKGAMGTCKVVQGKIHPNGYCVAFVPKS